MQHSDDPEIGCRAWIARLEFDLARVQQECNRLLEQLAVEHQRVKRLVEACRLYLAAASFLANGDCDGEDKMDQAFEAIKSAVADVTAESVIK